ncbi:MAG: CbtB domain-containing protein [Thermoproteota archaeon]
MSQSKEIAISKSSVSIFAVTILVIVFVFGLFFIGYDQGHLFSIVLGEQAFEDLYIHELTHDMRHAAGFPCH